MDVIFYSGDISFAKDRPVPKSLENLKVEYYPYTGWRVIVTGQSAFKGYRAIIKSTSNDGIAEVELQAKLIQSKKIANIDISKLSYFKLVLNTFTSSISNLALQERQAPFFVARRTRYATTA
jgi:hypothetical protein